MEFARPTELGEALSLLAKGDWAILAGGTDYYPSLQESSVTDNVLDITALASLRGISEDDEYWRIGALTTWADIIDAPFAPAFDALKLAAREVGSVQIQNRATVAGNLCNASPAADGVPPLLCLDALVEMSSEKGSRVLPLSGFLTGYRASALAADEIVSAILVPKVAGRGRSHFLKLGARKYLVISISMVAVRLVEVAGLIEDAAISVGACSVVAQRLTELEAVLRGKPFDSGIAALVDPQHFAVLSPIDDVRASAGYREIASVELVRRALREAVS